MNNKPKVLFIMHMPPPVHGASMVGKYIHDSEVVNSEFECHYLNPTTAKNLEDVNKFRFGKVFDVFGLIRRIMAKVREMQPDVVYFTANAAGMPFYKDYLIVKTLQTSLRREASRRADGKVGEIVVHYHNKGVATRQNRFFDNLLYRSFFKDLKIILLAENLYSDIKKYVKREDVQICGNGIPDLSPSISPLDSTGSPQVPGDFASAEGIITKTLIHSAGSGTDCIKTKTEKTADGCVSNEVSEIESELSSSVASSSTGSKAADGQPSVKNNKNIFSFGEQYQSSINHKPSLSEQYDGREGCVDAVECLQGIEGSRYRFPL